MSLDEPKPVDSVLMFLSRYDTLEYSWVKATVVSARLRILFMTLQNTNKDLKILGQTQISLLAAPSWTSPPKNSLSCGAGITAADHAHRSNSRQRQVVRREFRQASMQIGMRISYN